MLLRVSNIVSQQAFTGTRLYYIHRKDIIEIIKVLQSDLTSEMASMNPILSKNLKGAFIDPAMKLHSPQELVSSSAFTLRGEKQKGIAYEDLGVIQNDTQRFHNCLFCGTYVCNPIAERSCERHPLPSGNLYS
jgi:hypothetical protein